MQTINNLKQQFQNKHVSFTTISGGLICIDVKNSAAEARICLHGGHIMSFQPTGEEPVLWMSEKSYFEEWKPIRGGIPVCWPWFGAHPRDKEKPAHGFARLAEWTLESVEDLSGSETKVVLSLQQEPKIKALWDHKFELNLSVVVGRELTFTLTMKNTSQCDFLITTALHTYFNISDIEKIRISGFDGIDYIDTLDHTDHTQAGDIVFNAETDLVYKNTKGPYVIHDEVLKRSIKIEKTGSNTAVVWNPWIAKAKRMPDFGDQEYHGMVCVETTNAQTDEITLPPQGSHTIGSTISVVR